MITPITSNTPLYISEIGQETNNYEYNKNLKSQYPTNEHIPGMPDTDKNEQPAEFSFKSDKFQKVSYDEFQKKIQSTLEESNITIEFSKDNEHNRMIIKLINASTKEVVRQIPSEVSLKIARIISQSFGSGQIADAKI